MVNRRLIRHPAHLRGRGLKGASPPREGIPFQAWVSNPDQGSKPRPMSWSGSSSGPRWKQPGLHRLGRWQTIPARQQSWKRS